MASFHYSLFTLPGSKEPTTARKYHISRLYDILQLSIQRYDYVRARKSWAILVRCKEVDWKVMWRTGAVLLGESQEECDEVSTKKSEYLSTMMLRNTDMRESILQELALSLILAGHYRKALDELELYLPSSPYEDNPTLHVYAGLLCLYLAQPTESDDNTISSWNRPGLRDAKQYLERAKSLNAEDVVASAWLEEIPTLTQEPQPSSSHSDDEPEQDNGLSHIRSKRART